MTIIRDLTNLKKVNATRFSKAVAMIVIDDYEAYLALIAMIDRYDSAAGTEKTKVGNEFLDSTIAPELYDAIDSFVSNPDVQ